MIDVLLLHEYFDGSKVLVNLECIASLQESKRGNTTIVTLKDGRAWQVSETLSSLLDTISKVAER